ncbi:hypothetical protein V6Z11_A07G218600 [Gossypium hirsutum]
MDGAVRSPSLITDSSSQMVLVDSGEISTRNPSSTSISTKKGEEIHGLLACVFFAGTAIQRSGERCT